MFRQFFHIISWLFVSCISIPLVAQETEKSYLSGTGNDNTVHWEFLCTGGRNAGKWTTIPVPSCWELQGFGKYDYGFAKDSIRGKEKGMYRHRFNVPASWKNKVVNIVFEGVMTDAEVKVNGKLAGPQHQGAFYAFRYDISKLLRYGKQNLLEVTVAKHSANESVNAAERRADFWLFGGIFRPVWLEILPQVHIRYAAINAKANGAFTSTVTLNEPAEKATAIIYNAAGRSIGEITGIAQNGVQTGFTFNDSFPTIVPWNPEFPTLYKVVFTIYRNGMAQHTLTKKFGFRTVEVKQRDGVYVNGVKVKMKGVNRHSFWPTSGRTTSKKISIDDVLLMKDMNMNAVRMSHYPPDDHFLDVCDSLGLFVMDELAGWHGHYDTRTGSKLLKEMIDHDAHHPSIIFWANGNEGGHNLELDTFFTIYDLQQRPVVHPWQLFGGIETQHYREYNYGIGNYENGREIVMPTEFLHGQFDGGHGAGLDDYWEKMWHNPLSAGGFLWDFADQGVLRKDKNDSIDTDKHRGADGIVGPFREKEGSYFTIKEIWSPVYVERREITPAFDGTLQIENRYHFTNLDQCGFTWQLKQLNSGKTLNGSITAPNLKSLERGSLPLSLPKDWNNYDVLYFTASDPHGRNLFTWSFPIRRPAETALQLLKNGNQQIQLREIDSLYHISANNIDLIINRKNGKLQQVKNAKGIIPLTNGPVLQEGENNFKIFHHYFNGDHLIIASGFNKKESYNVLQWTIYPSGQVKMEVQYFPAAYFTHFAGVNFSFPEDQIRSITWMGNGPYRVWKNRLKGNRFGIWNKIWNNTETGESWNYPEFKGYHSNIYWCRFITGNNAFTVFTENEDLFLRLFTPAWKTDQWHNYEPFFPSGDISFMQAIPAIGTKTQRAETTGPMGARNILYDYEKDPARALRLTVYFDFSGNNE